MVEIDCIARDGGRPTWVLPVRRPRFLRPTIMSTRHFLRLCAIAAVSLAAACSTNTEPDPVAPSAPLDALPRALSTGEQRVVGAANDFSFALFRRLTAAQKDSNVSPRPLSASRALGMAMTGTAGTTYDEMRTTLGFDASASDTEIGESYKSLIALLRGLDPGV